MNWGYAIDLSVISNWLRLSFFGGRFAAKTDHTTLRRIMLCTWDIRMMALMTRPDSLSAIASLKRLKS